MALDEAHAVLGWPSPADILSPPGAGPSVVAELARQKIEHALSRVAGGAGVRVGVLARDATADATEEPLAVVCDFPAPVSRSIRAEAHRLAWNFCRSKMLVILEPHLVEAWTCCEAPPRQVGLEDHPAMVQRVAIDPSIAASAAASEALGWVDLVSGAFVRRHAGRFEAGGRADETLLSNLQSVRSALIGKDEDHGQLEQDVAHDLLARIIFIQFLFHRKDASGRPALGLPELGRLHRKGVLSERYETFAEILRNHRDTYRLFQWLNTRFNGDLFPGKGDSKAKREAEWKAEMREVRPGHLALLALFVEGKLVLKGRFQQLYLWPLYSFDAIPLEFISSIYEEFVGAKPGVHYTPNRLVDFLLDGVLPWDGTEWNLRVLDPACGSGIFLVKAFQRLVHRWRAANPGRAPNAGLLRRLLQRNLFGVDLDPHAVRVASFSLYLAMCDEIDPRHYWSRMKFPRLRGIRLIHADFFVDTPGVDTVADAGRYDVVVGNPPWGERTETEAVRDWAKAHGWQIMNGSAGPLFLPKAARLTKRDGRVAMLQPAGTMLLNRDTTAIAFRRKLFLTYKVDEVVNLSVIRRELFANAIAPTCLVTLQPVEPDDEPIVYICPKPTGGPDARSRIVVEPSDVHQLLVAEAAHDPWVWPALALGGRRDLSLVRRLAALPNLLGLGAELNKRLGIVRGDRKRTQPALLERRILETPEFPAETFLHLDARNLPVNADPETTGRDSTTLAPFELPQLLVKRSWSTDRGRFRAAVVVSDATTRGALCTQSYVSVNVPASRRDVLDAACLSLNSLVATYFLFLTGSQLTSYVPTALVEEVLMVPIPRSTGGGLEALADFAELDARAREVFELDDVEWILIEDFVSSTLADFKGTAASEARGPTRRGQGEEPDLLPYCEAFLRVLHAAGSEGACATIYREAGDPLLPVRLVAIHFDWPQQPAVQHAVISSPELEARLRALDAGLLAIEAAGTGGVFFRRVARVYDVARINGLAVPTVYLIKPDVRRYWTRAAALRDADEVVANALLGSGLGYGGGNDGKPTRHAD